MEYTDFASHVGAADRLVFEAQTGKSDAAESLLNAYRPMVEAKANRYFLSGAEREDVIQEAYVGFWRAVCDYKPESPAGFTPFASLCITRQILSAIKASSRHKHLVLSDSASLDSDDGLQTCWEDSWLQQNHQAELRAAIEHRLTTLERLVLRGYLNGHSYQQMSAHLQCEVKSIDNAIQRIRRKANSMLISA
jgi:RNA polymerase sporulation-specific sigma factor